MRTKWVLALALCAIVVTLCSCESNKASTTPGEAAKSDGSVYNKYNIHYISEKGTNKASYANFTDYPGHKLLPCNSKIKVRASSKMIRIEDVATGQKINMEFHPGRMEMSAKQYVELITSPTPVSYDGLSDVDQQGIQAGEARVGMSKQGVMVAMGYPAKHRTPSLDNNSWTYWKGRHNTRTVEFDSSGKVTSVRD